MSRQFSDAGWKRRLALTTGALVMSGAGVLALPATADAASWITVSTTPKSCVHYSFGDVCTAAYKTQRLDIDYCTHPALPGGTEEWYSTCYRNVPI